MPLGNCKESPFPHPSSRNTTILTPLNLQIFFFLIPTRDLTSGLRHFVKTYGAEPRPNGRTEKQKYLTEPAKTQKKPKKLDNLGKYQNVITGLKIKTKKVITLVNV